MIRVILALIITFCICFATRISGSLVNYPHPEIRRLEYMIERGDWGGFIKETNKITSRKSTHDPELLAYIYLRLGLFFKQKMDYDTALYYYKLAMETYPDSTIAEDAETSIAIIHLLKGDLQKARDIFAKILNTTKDPEQFKFVNYWLKRTVKLQQFSKSIGPVSASCGKVAILAVVERINLPVPLTDILLIPHSEKGMSLAQIKEFFDKKGIKTKIVKGDAEKLLKNRKPFIALLKESHYIVVIGRKDNLVAYMDPAKGRSVLFMTEETLKKEFSGYAIVFEDINGLEEVAISEARTIYGGRCPCCPANELGDKEDNPLTAYDTSGPGGRCEEVTGFPLIKTNMANLNLVITDVDFRYKHFGLDVKFKRTYNADSSDESIFGKGWSWYYGARLHFPVSYVAVNAYTSTGRIIRFSKDAYSGKYVPQDEDIYDTLSEENGRFYYRRKRDGSVWVYDGDGKLIEVRDRNGNSIRLEYKDNTVPFKPVRMVDSAGREILFKYNNQGYVSEIVFFNGTSAKYFYDNNGYLIKTIDPYGTVVEYEYDNNGYLVKMKTPKGEYTFNYKLHPREGYYLVSIVLPNGAVKNYTPDPQNHYNTIVEYPDGTWIMFKNIGNGWTYEIINPKGTVVRYDFINGRRTHIYDQYGNLTRIFYDERGNPTKIVYPDGSQEYFSFNEQDLLTSYRDGNGFVYEMFYDDKGNLEKIVYPDGRYIEFSNNDKGLPVSVNFSSGRSIKIDYDSFGYPKVVTLPSGRIWKLKFNTTGDVVEIKDPEGNTFTYSYDELRRLTKIKDPMSFSYKIRYNHLFPVEFIDQEGKITKYFYDSLDMLIKVCESGECYSYKRNSAGRLIGLVDFLEKEWEILRDIAGHYNGIVDPAGNRMVEYYDNKKKLIYKELPDGSRIDYSYDRKGRLVRISYPDGSSVTYSYDNNDNIVSANNNNTYINILYNPVNQPTSFSDTSLGITLSYTYNEDGYIETILYPGNIPVAYKYNEDGNIASISIGGLGKIEYVYNKRGLLEKKIIGNAVIEYTYDKRGLPVSFKLKDSKGDYINIEVTRDGIGRVTSYKLSSSLEIKRDAFKDIPLLGDAVYDSSSQILLFTADGTYNEFTHDKMGNLIEWKKGNTTAYFEYSGDQKLKRVKNGNEDILFLYNPFGLRWKKITPEYQYEYLYDLSRNLIYERIKDKTGNVKEERMYIYIPGMLDRPEAMILRKEGKIEVYYYFKNHQGSTVGLIDGEGRIVNIYDYWPDGNIRYMDEKINQPFRYTGAYHDDEVNLYYLRARYYSPVLRRFLQRDPILFEGGINLYSYTGCDFVNYGDWEGTGGLVAVAVGTVMVGFGSIYIICTKLCFLDIEKECTIEPSNDLCDIDKDIQELICLRRKFSRCPKFCRPWLEMADCIANKEICAADYAWDLIVDIFRRLLH